MLKIIKQNMRELNEASVFTFNITETHKSYTTKSRLRAIFHTWRKRKKNVSEKKMCEQILLSGVRERQWRGYFYSFSCGKQLSEYILESV